MPFIIAFTGHRPSKLGGYGAHNPRRDALKQVLAEILLRKKRSGHSDVRCISGMALGFDQWAAEVCIDVGIPFEAAVPFEGQERLWPAESQRHYYELLAEATTVHVVCPGGYSPSKMQTRNEWMVDRADEVIAAWNGSPGGTRNCIRYAGKRGKVWVNLLAGK